MLDLDTKRSITVVAGAGNTGKTTCSNLLLANGDYDFRFAFDPEGEAASRFGLAPTRTPFDLAAHLVRGWVLFDPTEIFGSDYERAFAFFCEWVFEKSCVLPGEKVLLVDEVWKLCPNRTIPFPLANCVRLGRKRRLAMIFNTQTPNELPGVILNEVSEFVAFRLQSEPALKLAEARGFSRLELSELPDLHFVSRTDRGGELRGRLPL